MSVWDRPNPFVIELTATADDVDSYGHVNNAVYLKWLERCAWAHSESVGLSEGRCIDMRRGMAVRTMKLDYLAAARAGDVVLVGNWIVACDGRLRASRRFQVVASRTETTLLRGEIDYVCLNLDNGRPVRMPSEFAARYTVSIGTP